MTEHDEQVALFAWARAHEEEIPALALLFAIPNGGWRHKATAAKLKAEGVKRGVPDIFLPVPVDHYYCGLFIEMKAGRNRPTPEQTTWLDDLRDRGYLVAVCYSCEEAKRIICNYLKVDTCQP